MAYNDATAGYASQWLMCDTGDKQGPLPASCSEVLARNWKASDGTYLIDADGPGGADSAEVACTF